MDHGTQALLILEFRRLRPREDEVVQAKSSGGFKKGETPPGREIREDSLEEEAFEIGFWGQKEGAKT